jgi:hypothetical protein
MLQSRLTLSNMKQLQFGLLDQLFQAAVAKVAKDCQERPGLDQDREVAVVFKLRPTVNKKQGTCDGDRVKFTGSVQCKIPKEVSEEYTAVVGKDGEILFRYDEPNDPTANHLFDPDTGEIKETGDGK